MPLPLTVDSESFISLEEVKAQANITSDKYDDELDLFRGAAQEAVEGIIGPVIPRVVVETHYGFGPMLLRVWPILSVDSVTAGDVAITHTANPAVGVVTLYPYPTYGPITVTYTVGRSVVPDSIRVAALIIAEHLWSTQRGSAPSVTLQGDEAAPQPGMAYSIPNRATDLLRPYLLPPVVG